MDKHADKTDPLREKTLNLAIRTVKLYQYLTVEKKEYVVSKQLLRAGTNPGAMVREAANAESGLDFIHKLAVDKKKQEKQCIGLNCFSKLAFYPQRNMNPLMLILKKLCALFAVQF